MLLLVLSELSNARCHQEYHGVVLTESLRHHFTVALLLPESVVCQRFGGNAPESMKLQCGIPQGYMLFKIYKKLVEQAICWLKLS